MGQTKKGASHKGRENKESKQWVASHPTQSSTATNISAKKKKRTPKSNKSTKDSNKGSNGSNGHTTSSSVSTTRAPSSSSSTTISLTPLTPPTPCVPLVPISSIALTTSSADSDDDSSDDDVDLDQLATSVARRLASSVLAGLPASLPPLPAAEAPRHRITKAEKGDDADGRGKFIKVGGIVRLRTDIELNGASDDNGTDNTPDLLASIGKKQVLSSLNPNERKRAADKKKPDTAGSGWFDLPATPMTAETAASLKVIGLRQYLDPKRFYKKDKGRKTPKYFQIGTVIGGAGDSKLGKLTRKERAPNMMKEILADTDTRGYLKRKFTEVQTARGTGAQKHKRFKKKGPGSKRK